MGFYQSLASVYDRLMYHIDYVTWCDQLVKRWAKIGQHPSRVTDLGCGTGSILVELAGRGYQMCGVDQSPDMLMVCREKLDSRKLDALLLEKDIRNMDGHQTDAVICFCDTLNYLVVEKDLLQVFRQVNRMLPSGGSFIFDLRTPYYYQHILFDNEWIQEEEDVILLWRNDSAELPLMHIDLTFFLHQGNNLYRRHEEFHTQRCYTEQEIECLLAEAGFHQITKSARLACDDPEIATAERMYFSAIKSE